MAIFVEVNIVLFCFGTCVAYVIAVGDILQPLSNVVFSPGHVLTHKPIIMSLFVCMCMLPLSLVSKISSLRFSSLLGVISILFLVLAIAFRSTQHVLTFGIDTSQLKWTTSSLDHVFTAIPIIMFAFTCQVNVFSIYTELQRPSIRRMHKVVNRAFSVNTGVYVLMGVFGYVHYLSATNADILKNLSITDPLIGMAQFGVGLTVVLAYPLNIYPARFTVEMLFFAKSAPSQARFIVITVVMVLCSLFVAIFTPNIDSVFTILGSTTSAIVCFILPAAFYIRCMDGDAWQPAKYGAWMLLAMGVGIGVVATAVSIKNIATA